MNLLAYYPYHNGLPFVWVILLVVLIILLLPSWPYMSSRDIGYRPAGVILVIVIILLLVGCQTVKDYGVGVAKQLAVEAIDQVAQHYHIDQSEAKSLASAGLSAAADVAQGYVDKKPPLEILVASPGVKGVGQKVVDFLKTKGYITQSTVNTIHNAAQIAANSTSNP
jgi:hypothetical protein